MEKMTYAIALNAAITCEALPCEVREKLSALLVQINKKVNSERKPTKTQTLNNGLQSVILNAMEFNKPYTVSELIQEVNELNELSNQKVSALVKSLVENGSLNRVVEKGKAFFVKVA